MILEYLRVEILIVEKKTRYDLLANHCGSMNGYKIRIILYVMTWKEITTNFYKKYRSELNIDSRTQAYIQARANKLLRNNSQLYSNSDNI
ncbi:hypothetical protein NAPIS_ORF00112 [Vairimorpha apis BRL 01]|uniref:Uncharacterized protein n=1 Tax=Vairimorpha apis BRL 01 TaxID=1037528 RepID=T0MGS2_9MICR|nr:hypothetical protein NAPIS_ORF00112 [Vairimorpha apis BRL 01]